MALSFREIVCTNVTHEITGAWTFNRGVGTPPFVVTPSPTVATTVTNLSAGAISGVAISTTAPSAGQVLVASSSTAAAWGAVGASVGDVTDSLFRIVDNGDATKKLAFEISGVTTGTTRTWTVPNASGTVPLLELAQAWTAIQTFSNHVVVVGELRFDVAGVLTTTGASLINIGPTLRWTLGTGLTTSKPVISMGSASSEWNSAGTTFHLIDLDVGDTASASASTLLRLRTNTTDRYVVSKAGAVTTGTWSATAIGATVGGTAQTSWTTGDLLYASAADTLAKLAVGTTGQVLTVSGGVPAWSASSSKRHREGLLYRYSSATALIVATGSCRDSTDTENLTLAAESTVTITTNGIEGLVRKTATGTATTDGSAVVTMSSSALADLAAVAMSGTVTSAATAVTGTGTKFLSEFAVGDLIGTTTNTRGFAVITAIASDTALTLDVAPPGSAFGGEAPNKVECNTLKVASNVVRSIRSITSNGLTIVASAIHAAASGQTVLFGDELDVLAATPTWYYVYVAKGATGTKAMLSIRRTTPWLPSGYDQKFRRIGSILNDSSANLAIAFQREVSSAAVDTIFESPVNTFQLVSSGGATSWTAFSCATCAPPTSTQVYLHVFTSGSSSQANIYVRPRNLGSSTVSRDWYCSAPSGGREGLQHLATLDGAQYADYALSTSAGTPAFINGFGYREAA